MKTIYKYSIKPDDEVLIEMPKDAVILTVGVQYDEVCLWVLVDTDAVIETRSFVIYGTGHKIDDVTDKKYVGTFILYNGSLVFHLFEKQIWKK